MKAKKKILTVLGARPQFIKSEPLSHIMGSDRSVGEVIVHTGQHYDFRMYGIFLKEFSLAKPKYFLGVNKCSNAVQVAKILEKLSTVIEAERPDLVLVYGDTNATLGGALAAKEYHIPLAHIEAGLRSFRTEMAEELNRVVTDRISDLLFAPVSEAVRNLKKEGLTTGVYHVGDVLYDVLRRYERFIGKGFREIPKGLGLKRRGYHFLTLHRAENVDSPSRLRSILTGVNNIDRKVVFSVHPRTRKRIKEFGLENLARKMCCIAPQSYIKTLALAGNASSVLTDSGGVQREAYMLKTPCITLRAETEWNETLEGGWNRVIDIDSRFSARLPELVKDAKSPEQWRPIFGDGQASAKISGILRDYLR
ncbi:MAG: UDP-N-acetylglucosamine 2-epimerase (non-hydrolyzing) [Candidatus Omnitrophica bacterium]|nr:UDP-N-acetylglucosamine 2-epimerase (non-hydrolyzing) [Candidatus Omnitrophota bacterium]